MGGPQALTAEAARERVAEIRKQALEDGDDHETHKLGDELYLDVLRAVARGDLAVELAAIALEVEKIQFQRWYS